MIWPLHLPHGAIQGHIIQFDSSWYYYRILHHILFLYDYVMLQIQPSMRLISNVFPLKNYLIVNWMLSPILWTKPIKISTKNTSRICMPKMSHICIEIPFTNNKINVEHAPTYDFDWSFSRYKIETTPLILSTTHNVMYSTIQHKNNVTKINCYRPVRTMLNFPGLMTEDLIWKCLQKSIFPLYQYLPNS